MRTSIATGLVISILSACSGTPVTESGEPIPEQVLVPIAYVTDRAIGDTSSAPKYFGPERGDVSYGIATIGISTKKQGVTGYADWQRWEPNLNKPKNKNQVLDVNPMTAEAIGAHLKRWSSTTGDRSVLLYIHGYAKSFGTVARNTGILAYELNLRGAPILYSWPSRGSAAAYPADMTSMDWSVVHLEQFLRLLLADPDIDTVHLLAHSMGNRGLLKAMLNLLDDADILENWKFGEIVLFAPDVDADVFRRDIAPRFAGIPSRVSMYISGVDVPLDTSGRVNRYGRAGNAKKEIIIVDGLETVDVTPVSRLLNGHSAHRDVPEIQADLHFLFNEGLGADSRPTLEAVDTPDGRYWQADDTYEVADQ